ncbi:hypothetical protein GCM10023114_43820 [Mycolicibacterium sediminis]|uniref:Uncharacterized protein n=1 Tax=Mycolicibacterium sediminis TaxID=1286180 RepID=A0A7I7QUL6_9MYCO|nr:hypothetical protein MSEDJ_41100 [Mycolicibacterium sediminis]
MGESSQRPERHRLTTPAYLRGHRVDSQLRNRGRDAVGHRRTEFDRPARGARSQQSGELIDAIGKEGCIRIPPSVGGFEIQEPCPSDHPIAVPLRWRLAGRVVVSGLMPR